MGKKISVEVGLCTKDMAKENPVKDFEILIEEYKGKWSKQMYDYFKECLNEIKKKLRALEVIKEKGLYWDIQYQPYEEKNDYRAWDNELYESVKLTKEEYDLLKEVLNDESDND